MLGAVEATMLNNHELYWQPSGATPVLWLKFDDGSGTTAKDYSGNAYNATLYNTPAWAVDKQPCLDFESSSSQYGHLGDVLDMRTYNMTVCGWIKIESFGTSYATIISKVKAASVLGRWGIYLDTSTSKMFAFMEISGGSLASCTTASTLSTGAWLFITARWTRGSSVQTFINGTSSGSPSNICTSAATDLNTTLPCRVGCYSDASENPTYYFDGKMSNLQVFHSALSDSDISNMYTYNRGLYGV